MYPNWVHLTYCDPHAYAERYPHSPSGPPHVEGISIHGPKCSATRSGTIVTITRSGFNPRAHAGRDRTRIWCHQDQAVSIHTPTRGVTAQAAGENKYLVMFQSTRPRGARLCAASSVVKLICFNPRAHAGRDLLPHHPRCGYKAGFNPRAHAGRDASIAFMIFSPFVSIHAPTRGAT